MKLNRENKGKNRLAGCIQRGMIKDMPKIRRYIESEDE